VTEEVEAPRWRRLYDELARLKPGDLYCYEDMGLLLGLDFLEPADRKVIGVLARRAAAELRRKDNRVCRIMRGHGYQVAQPGQVIEIAQRHQRRAVVEVERGIAVVETIDQAEVDVTTARLVTATLLGLSRQAAMMRQLDVRQDRLEVAMAALTDTTSTQLIETRAAVDQLRERLDEMDRRSGRRR